MELSRSEERRIAVQKGERLTESEITEKLFKLWDTHEMKFVTFSRLDAMKKMYNYKTIPELIKILTKAGVDQAEINKVMGIK